MYSDFRYSLGRKSESRGRAAACISLLLQCHLAQRSSLEKEDGAPFALRAIIALLCSLSQGLSPVGAFLKLFHNQLPFRFDQWETLAGDWKAGGRKKPTCFSPSHSTSVASLWGTKSLL